MVNGFPKVETIRFPTGNSARLVRVSPGVDIDEVIRTLELGVPRALLVLNGRTADLEDNIEEQLKILFDDLANVIVERKITIITGGTNAGIFSLFGKALQNLGGPLAPCVGVTIAGRASQKTLEPHHTHFVLVEGDSWGEETAAMYRLVGALARDRPSLAVFAGGGEIAIAEMEQNVAQNREMIFVAGSKGSTDDVVTALSDARLSDPRFEHIIRKGRITTFGIDQPPSGFSNLICNRLLLEER